MRLPFTRPDPEKYKRAIRKGLDRAYRGAEAKTLQLDDLKLIVLSDQHRGARDGADDFQRCERAYNAALAHYFQAGHRLLALGDVEELWECSPGEVLDSYRRTMELEAEFHREGRYDRFWGNHDDLWEEKRQVEKHFGAGFEGLEVREALRLRIRRGEEELGELFLVHGHQGTLESDRFKWLSRFFVRHVWRRAQRRLNMASTSPAVDWKLRGDHDRAMFEWARDHPGKVVLITGHTHRPVFEGRTAEPDVRESAEELEAELQRLRESGASAGELAGPRARLEWARAEEARVERQAPEPVDPPCYFNTGCCSYGDGDVTGLEIEGGEIRLVRWPDRDGEPEPMTLEPDSLADVFRRVAAAQAAPDAPEPAARAG